MTVYSESFKTKLVQKMLLPNARPVSALAQDAGLPEGTLYRWKKEITLAGIEMRCASESGRHDIAVLVFRPAGAPAGVPGSS